MLKRVFRSISMLLVLVLLIQVVPAQAWDGLRLGSTQQLGTAPAEAVSGENISVVAEITGERTKYSKEFLLSNGLHLSTLYAQPVHYEKDGTWHDIDNTLKLHNGSYINTAGEWDVAFPQSFGSTQSVRITKNGYTLAFGMPQRINSGKSLSANSSAQVTALAEQTAVQEALTAAKAESEYPETVLEKLSSRLTYENIHTDTDVIYDLSANQVKESVVLKQYDNTLLGFSYLLETGEMTPVLAQEGHITFYDETGSNAVMVMAAPFLQDANMEICNDVQVSLTGKGSSYILTYTLPQSWLSAEERQWPVILDPVVQADLEVTNVRDASVAESTTFSYTSPTLETGYYRGEGKQRAFLKYREIPALTSADVVVNATMTLYKFVTSASTAPIEVHKVLGTWESESITWSNKPDYDPNIEDFVTCCEKRYYKWDVTDIVRDWYATGNNFGMMFKASDAVENAGSNNFKQFYSSDYSSYPVYMPALNVVFRNNNGLESCWDYTSASAGRAGTGYVNSYTGNLVWTRSDMGFAGNRMPVTVSFTYNTNDCANNSYGMGYGWRTNFNQQLYRWDEDGNGTVESDENFYIWEDGDGTSNYFKYSAEKQAIVNDDGLEHILTVHSSGTSKYILTDRSGNTWHFDSQGRLYKIENGQEEKSSCTVTYLNATSKQIQTVTDGAGRKYEFEFNEDDGLLNNIQFTGTGETVLTYVEYFFINGDLDTVRYKDGEEVFYTYTDNHLLETASNINGYRLEYGYNEPQGDFAPWRVTAVREYDGQKAAGQMTYAYGRNQTAVTSSFWENGAYVPNTTLLYQFNDWGNTVSVQDDEGRAQFMEYSRNIYSDESGKVNQLNRSSKLQNTVVNLLTDSSFEASTLWTADGAAVSIAAGGYLGSKALQLTGSGSAQSAGFTAKAGKTYVFSGYVKTAAGTAKLGLTDGTAAAYSQTASANQWTRLQISYTNESSTDKLLYAVFAGENATAYLDCVQAEEMPTASRYNLVQNGDFRQGATGWTGNALESADGTVTADSAAVAQLSTGVYQITGNFSGEKRISQSLGISGSQGDSYVFSGWAKGNSAAINQSLNETAKTFGLKLIFHNTDGTQTEQYVQFNTDVSHWQYAAAPAVADKAYTNVTVQALYGKNANTVCFDGLQVFKEAFGSSFTYDADGKVTSVIDLQNKETTYVYEGNDLTRIMENNQAKMTYDYDDYHNVISATTQEGLSYTFDYDDWGNNTEVSITSNGVTISSSANYTDNGNLLSSTVNALGKTTSYGYDSDTGLLEWVQYPEDSEDTRTEYEYDSMYRTASAELVTDSGLAMSVDYTYDLDLLASIQTPTTTYSFTYGDFDLRSSVKIGTRTLASYTYGTQNRLQRLDYGNGDFVQYTYDTRGRMIQASYENGKNISYAYDNSGNLATVTDSQTGTVTTYYYDLLDRQVGYREVGTNLDHAVTYIYNEDNQVSSMTEVINGAATTYSYTYDEDNRIVSETVNGITVTYTYDAFGRLANRTVKNGDTVIQTNTPTYSAGSLEGSTTGQVSSYNGYTYTYDDNGNILTVSDGTYTTSYEYDSANQLIRENNQALNFTHTWTYDNAGNITSREEYDYTTGSLGMVRYICCYYNDDRTWGDLLTSYDENTITYDGIGNPLTDGEWTYTWQNGRQLAAMTKGSTTWTFTYDANGMRTSRVDEEGGWAYTYTYNGDKLVRLIVDGQEYFDLSFTYDASGTPLTITENGYTYYYVTNLQGDVIGIQNSSGQQFVTYTYDAWGKDTGHTNSQTADFNPLRYRGYVYDVETELYYLQSRYYNPQTGRFINADGYNSTGQGLLGNNMFAYCKNNPIIHADRSGTRCVVNHKLLESDGRCPFTSDGKNMSDDLLNYLYPYIEGFASFNNIQLHVSSQGRNEITYYRDQEATALAIDLFLLVVPFSEKVEKVIEIGGVVFDAVSLSEYQHEPDGWYDFYSVTITWDEAFEHENGVTYTEYHYVFSFIWDYNTQEKPFWNYVDGTDYTKSYAIFAKDAS